MKVAALLLPSSRDVVRGVSSVDSVVMVILLCTVLSLSKSKSERLEREIRHFSSLGQNDSGTRSLTRAHKRR